MSRTETEFDQESLPEPRAGVDSKPCAFSNPERPPNIFDIPIRSAIREKEVGFIEPGSKLDELVDDFKRGLARQALRQAGGNHRRAAALLGIHRSSFTRMLHRLARSADDRRDEPQEKGTDTPSAAH